MHGSKGDVGAVPNTYPIYYRHKHTHIVCVCGCGGWDCKAKLLINLKNNVQQTKVNTALEPEES